MKLKVIIFSKRMDNIGRHGAKDKVMKENNVIVILSSEINKLNEIIKV